jgi:hypothetical protein
MKKAGVPHQTTPETVRGRMVHLQSDADAVMTQNNSLQLRAVTSKIIVVSDSQYMRQTLKAAQQVQEYESLSAYSAEIPFRRSVSISIPIRLKFL